MWYWHRCRSVSAGDAYGFISCLTAIDLEGRVLWQLGEPSINANILGKVSADMPFQIYDIDGDGKDEVIVGRNFEIQILEGTTGKIKKSVKTPCSDDNDSELIGVPYQSTPLTESTRMAFVSAISEEKTDRQIF